MTRSLSFDVTVGELVSRFGGEISGSPDTPIRRLATLNSAIKGDLSFLVGARHAKAAAATTASAVVATPDLRSSLPQAVTAILVADPYAHFARIARWFEQQTRRDDAIAPAIHPTAAVSPEVKLGNGVTIGPYAVIESGAVIGDEASIGAHCYIGYSASVGARTRLYPRVTLLDDCTIGDNGIVHSGTTIGSDGFGFAREEGRWAKIPQLGAVRIGNDVEIGANCSIDRGALDDTVIGDGCKLDNLIQIAHNVQIGEHSALAGCVGVAGSAIIGRRCMIGGGAGILGHLEICDDVVVSSMSLVTRSISKPGFYSGVFPLMPNAGWERAAATLRQLPALRDRIRALERNSNHPSADPSPEDSKTRD